MPETSPFDGRELTQNTDVGVARSFGLQPDFKTPTVGQLFNVPIEVVDINDYFAGIQDVDTGAETTVLSYRWPNERSRSSALRVVSRIHGDYS